MSGFWKVTSYCDSQFIQNKISDQIASKEANHCQYIQTEDQTTLNTIIHIQCIYTHTVYTYKYSVTSYTFSVASYTYNVNILSLACSFYRAGYVLVCFKMYRHWRPSSNSMSLLLGQPGYVIRHHGDSRRHFLTSPQLW